MYVQGVFYILIVVVLWVAGSEITQLILNNLDYDKPLFLTYMSMSCFSLWLPVWWINYRNHVSSAAFAHMCRSLFVPVIVITPTWFLANALFNISLDLTTVASNTVLSNTSSLWTLLLGYRFLGTSLSTGNVLSVLFTVTGSVLVATGDSHNWGVGPSSSTPSIPTTPSQSVFIGDAVAVAAAFLYAVYTTMLKGLVPAPVQTKPQNPEEENDMEEPVVYDNEMLLFGLIGVFGAIVLWPLLVIAHYQNIETFGVPNKHVFVWFAINLILGTVIPQLLWAKGMLLTSPLIATLGLSLTIPLSMAWDWFLHNAYFSSWYIFGSVLVLGGFVVSSLFPDHHHHHHHNNTSQSTNGSFAQNYGTMTRPHSPTAGGDSANGLTKIGTDDDAASVSSTDSD
eukprot:PhF_6_TR2191/c0_g1_i3/m.3622/K15289/SLC35F5; solute carrier family 35, member F5